MKLTKDLKQFLNKPRSRRVAWASPSNPEVSAISVALGQELDRDIYLSLLADRVEKLVKQEDDPKQAEKELRRALDQANLLPPSKLSLRELVIDNMELRTHLRYLGVLPKRGEVVKSDNREARRVLQESDLWKWLDHLTRVPPEQAS